MLLPFILGILLAPSVSARLSLTKNLIVVTLLVIAAVALFIGRRWTVSLSLSLVALFFLGSLYTRIRFEVIPPNHLDNYFRSKLLDRDVTVEIVGRLYDDPEMYKGKMVLPVKLETIRKQEQARPVSGNVRISVYSSTSTPEEFFPQGLYYGDRLRAVAALKKPRNFSNPGSFDYAAYLKINEIDAIASVKAPALIDPSGENVGNPILKRIYALRRAIAKEIKHYFADVALQDADKRDPLRNQAAATILALFLGDRILLNSTVEEAFKKTGVYHVLVVSGAHVAMLAYILFQFLKLFKIPEWVQSLLVVAAIVLYTLLIGAQPSVLRASIMIITYLVGKILYREGNFLNSVSLAAFVLLALNPLWVYDIGFQLSFAAVYAICLIGVPLVEFLVKPYFLGLSAVFSERLFVAPTGWERRARRIRFAAEFFIEELLERFPRVSKRVWVKLSSLLARLLYDLSSLLIISFAIEVVLLALAVPYFNRVVLLSPIVNLAVVPLSTLILFSMLIFLPLVVISTSLAAGFSIVVKALTKLMLVIVTAGGEFRFMQYRIPTPPIWVVVGFLVMLALAIVIEKKPLRWMSILALMVFALFMITYPFPPSFDRGKLSMTVVDIGQGDCLFVQFPYGSMALVDGGGLATVGGYAIDISNYEDGLERRFDIGEQVVSPFLWSRGIKTLDTLALTHAHHDHLSGLLSVVNNFRIGRAFEGRNPPNDPEYAEFLKRLRRKNIPLFRLKRKDTLEIDGVKLDVFNPIDNSPPAKVSNDDSLAVKLTFKNVALLLTGDIEKRVEAELLGDCANLKSQILKVPHHGSKSSSTEEFLNCVQPEVAIVSAGLDNPFGHPHTVVLERYQSKGIRLYKTVSDGAITVTTDGEKISVDTFLQKR